MFITINIKISPAAKLYSCFSIALRIKLDELHSVACDISNKGYEVTFGHRMLYSDEIFIFYGFYGNSMISVDFFSFKGWESYTTATDKGCTCGVDDIATDGTDIELREKYI